MSNFRDFLFDRDRTKRYALPLAMTGVRMGERLLLVGDDGPLFAQLASKVGLTGRCAVVVATEEAGARIESAAARAGVLLEDVKPSALPALPVGDGEFDVAVVNAGTAFLTGLDRPGRAEMAGALHRALRTGGRLLVVEGRVGDWTSRFRGQPAGLAAYRAEGGAVSLLVAAGFRPVRVLADREGQRFTEGLKT